MFKFLIGCFHVGQQADFLKEVKRKLLGLIDNDQKIFLMLKAFAQKPLKFDKEIRLGGDMIPLPKDRKGEIIDEILS